MSGSRGYEVRATFSNEKDARAFQELALELSDRIEFRTMQIVIPSPPMERLTQPLYVLPTQPERTTLYVR